jgi:hypothetical protein
MSGTALILLGIVAILVVVMRTMTSPKRRQALESVDRVRDAVDDGLREKYHNSLAAGSTTRRLARVYSQVDLSLLKSLLDSKGIPNDLLFGNAGNLRWNDSLIVVLESDYPAAKEIAEDYIAGLRSGSEAAVAGNPVNPGSRPPEIL